MGFRMPKAMSGSRLRLMPARLGALLPPPNSRSIPHPRRGGGMTALRRVAPLPLLLLRSESKPAWTGSSAQGWRYFAAGFDGWVTTGIPNTAAVPRGAVKAPKAGYSG